MTTHDLASASRREDTTPLLKTSFDVTFEGLPPVEFSSVEGIEAALEAPLPISSAVGPQKERGATLALRRGATGSRVLWEWYAASRSGGDAQRNGVITVRNATGEPVLRVSVANARPCRWRLGRLDALQTDVLLEEIELIVESLTLVDS